MNINQYDIKELCTLPPPYGGVTVYVKRLIRQLLADGYSVGGYYGKSCTDKKVMNSKMYNKWTWMQTSLFPIKIWKYLIETFPYKIVHSHFSLEGMVYLWTIKTIGRKHIVVTIHNSMNSDYYIKTNGINRFFLNKMLQSHDVTWIVVSEQGKRQLYDFPIKPIAPVHIIPAYIPVPEKKYIPLANDMQQYIQSHDKIIAFYGHSFMEHEGKDIYGFKTIIKVFSEIIKSTANKVGLVLCIADKSDAEKISSIHKYAKTIDIDNKIFWQVGAIDNIRTLWHKADIYVRPTSTDGDSVAIREVLDEGAVVIASNVCKRPEGVITYNYGDDNMLIKLIISNLKNKKKMAKPDYTYYNLMKNLYDKILDKFYKNNIQ